MRPQAFLISKKVKLWNILIHSQQFGEENVVASHTYVVISWIKFFKKFGAYKRQQVLKNISRELQLVWR